MLSIKTENNSFVLCLDGRELIVHTPEAPALFLGKGEETIRMYRGNFDIADRVSERLALRFAGMEGGAAVFTSAELAGDFRLRIEEKDGLVRLAGHAEDPRFNRLYLRLRAEKDEHVTGGGEQFSYLDLRGRLFPIWFPDLDARAGRGPQQAHRDHAPGRLQRRRRRRLPYDLLPAADLYLLAPVFCASGKLRILRARLPRRALP